MWTGAWIDVYHSIQLKVQQTWLTPWACLSTSYAVRRLEQIHDIFQSSKMIHISKFHTSLWNKFRLRLTRIPYQYPGTNNGSATKFSGHAQWCWPESTRTADWSALDFVCVNWQGSSAPCLEANVYSPPYRHSTAGILSTHKLDFDCDVPGRR